MDDERDRSGGTDVVGRHGRLGLRTALISTLTLASRLLGYVRESVMAAIFGDASTVNDAFNTAWRVPNLFRRLLGEGALATSLQTTLTEVDATRGDQAGRDLFLASLRVTALLLFGVCAVVMAFFALAPDVVPGPGWTWLGRDPDAVRELTLRLMPFVIFVCLAAQAAGGLQVRGEFRASVLAPIVLNVVWIATLIGIVAVRGWPGSGELAAGTVGPETVALRESQLELARVLSWAVLVAGALQVAIQVPALRAHGLMGRGVVRAAPEASRAAWGVLRTAAPLALGAAVYQVNVMIDGYMAQALLPRGGPSAYHYASRLQQFPVAIVATSAIAAVFPSLKALGHTGRRDELRALHDRTQFAVLFLALPACLGLFALAHPVCALLFQHGNFGEQGVDRTAATLAMLAFAIPPAGAVGLLSRTYYACGDLRTPVRVSIAMMVLNLVLNLAFVVGLDMDADGFALSTAITSWINMAVLWPGLVGRLGLPGSGSPWLGRVARTAAAAAPAAWVARLAHGAVLADGAPNGTRAGLALSAGLVAALAVFLALARALRLEELDVVRERWSRRRRSDR